MLQGVCAGFDEVLAAYREVVGTVQLSGPTSFAPLINKAVEIVKETEEVKKKTVREVIVTLNENQTMLITPNFSGH